MTGVGPIVDIDKIEEIRAHSVMSDTQDSDVWVYSGREIREKLERGGEPFVDINSHLRVRLNGAFVYALPVAVDNRAYELIAEFGGGTWNVTNKVNGRFLNK